MVDVAGNFFRVTKEQVGPASEMLVLATHFSEAVMWGPIPAGLLSFIPSSKKKMKDSNRRGGLVYRGCNLGLETARKLSPNHGLEEPGGSPDPGK
jgi:hypothetical protein